MKPVALSVLAVLAVAPAYAQQYPAYPQQQADMSAQRSQSTTVRGSTATGSYPGADGVQQSELSPVSDVVRATEERLDQLGYSTTPDGRFDADLRNSVLQFQSDNGLRPTGQVDLETLAALGIDVDPAGRVAASRQTATTTTVVEDQTAALVDDNSPDFPMLKDTHMSAPMISLDEGARFENYTGVPQPESIVRSGDIPGLEPGFPVENLID